MKVWGMIIGVMLATTSALADDVPQVKNRMTCTELSAKISELGQVAEPDEQTVAEIDSLKAEYRRACSRSAGARRTSGGARVITVAEENTSPQTEDVVDEPVADTEVTETVASDVAEVTEAELTLEQELANLDAGLCADGSQPNRFGCCGDEIFKDLGNTVFACCPKDDDGTSDCFPPIK